MRSFERRDEWRKEWMRIEVWGFWMDKHTEEWERRMDGEQGEKRHVKRRIDGGRHGGMRSRKEK